MVDPRELELLAAAIFGGRGEERLPVARRALRELRAVRATLDELEASLVGLARRDEVGWRELGDDLSLSHTTVRRRHSRRG